MEHLLGAFCQSRGLTKNVDKTKTMVVRTNKPHQYPMLTYKGEHVPFEQSFKYLDIGVPTRNKWNVCFESRLQAGWKSYNMLEKQTSCRLE